MGFSNYLATLDLSPGTAEKLERTYGAPTPKIPIGPPRDLPPSGDPYAPPTAAEMEQYGTDPGMAGKIANANAGTLDGQSVSAPSVEKGWTPELDKKRKAEGAERSALDAADPQGPADDGFPTYRDPNSGGGQATPVAPMRAIAAHWQPGTRSYQKQLGFNPEELKDGQYHRDVGAGHGLIAADKRLEASQIQTDADIGFAEQRQRAEEIAAARQVRLQHERDAYVLQEKDKLDLMSKAASEKVDMDAARGSLGSQMLGAIAIGLGQFGASLNGGPNTAYGIINDGINQRLKVQSENIANAGRRLSQEQGLYQQNLAEFGDKGRAILATKAQYLAQAQAQVDQAYAKGKATMNEAMYHDLQKQLADERAKVADEFSKLTHTNIAEAGNEHYVPTQYVGGAGSGQKGKEELYVPTLGGYARSKEVAEKLNTKGALRMQIGENMHKIYGLMKEAQGLSSGSPQQALRLKQIDEEIQGYVSDSLTKNTVLEGQGAMSEGDKKNAAEAKNLVNVSVQGSSNTMIKQRAESVKRAATSMLEHHRIEGEANGVQLGREVYVPGVGGPEARRQLQGRNKTPSKETQSWDDLVVAPKGVPKK